MYGLIGAVTGIFSFFVFFFRRASSEYGRAFDELFVVGPSGLGIEIVVVFGLGEGALIFVAAETLQVADVGHLIILFGLLILI